MYAGVCILHCSCSRKKVHIHTSVTLAVRVNVHYWAAVIVTYGSGCFADADGFQSTDHLERAEVVFVIIIILCRFVFVLFLVRAMCKAIARGTLKWWVRGNWRAKNKKLTLKLKVSHVCSPEYSTIRAEDALPLVIEARWSQSVLCLKWFLDSLAVLLASACIIMNKWQCFSLKNMAEVWLWRLERVVSLRMSRLAARVADSAISVWMCVSGLERNLYASTFTRIHHTEKS